MHGIERATLIAVTILTAMTVAWGQDATSPTASADAAIVIRGGGDSTGTLMDLPGVGVEARRAGDALAANGAVELVIRRGSGEEVFEEGVLLTQPGVTEELRPILRIDMPSGNAPEPDTAPGAGHYGIRSARTLDVEITGGALRLLSPTQIFWKTPEQSGWQRLVFHVQEDMAIPAGMQAAGTLPDGFDGRREVLAMVQHRYDPKGSGVIEGYPIGMYPDPSSPQANSYVQRHVSLYAPPEWFIQVSPETERLKISPHYTLGEFAPRTESGKTRFIVVRPELLRYMEAFHDAVRKKWGASARVLVYRGYLSPYERTRLASQGVDYTLFNRYQYGDGVVLAVNTGGGDGMSDLTGDGHVDQADALEVLQVAERIQGQEKLPGGIGILLKRHEPGWPEGPSVAVDLRGVQTRW